jgi:probable HAF family extracellular repeat protein
LATAGILLALVSLSFPPAAAQSYTATDLGAIGSGSAAQAISDTGFVAGHTNTTGGEHAFFWSPTVGMIDMGLLHSGDLSSNANGLNNSGAVVGVSGGSGFFWTQSEGMQDIGNLGSDGTEAYGINNSNEVVGGSDLDENGTEHAFLWTLSDGMLDLGTLGGYSSIALAMNDSEQVVGYSYLSDDITLHAFLWTRAGGMQDLGTLGGASSVAQAINAAGQVTGFSLTPSNMDVAFIWDSTHGMRSLGTGASAQSFALGINGHLQIVGIWMVHSSQAPFLWTSARKFQNLSALVSGGGSIKYVSAINNVGQIVGTDDNQHAVLLTPTK